MAPLLPLQFGLMRGMMRCYTHRMGLSAVRQACTDAKERLDKLITGSNKRVYVFMKGVPEAPQCGYSNAVVQILNAYNVDFDSFNVLSDEEIRKEVKAYSNWPTIPQVYIDGKFVGGCDILIQMHQSNELEKLFDGNQEGEGDTTSKTTTNTDNTTSSPSSKK